MYVYSVEHFISVDFKGRFSVGSRGVRLGGGGGRKRPVPPCAALCRAVPCRAARGGGGVQWVVPRRP